MRILLTARNQNTKWLKEYFIQLKFLTVDSFSENSKVQDSYTDQA